MGAWVGGQGHWWNDGNTKEMIGTPVGGQGHHHSQDITIPPAMDASRCPHLGVPKAGGTGGKTGPVHPCHECTKLPAEPLGVRDGDTGGDTAEEPAAWALLEVMVTSMSPHSGHMTAW